MQLEEEALMAESLGTSATGDYCHGPRTAASALGSSEIGTLKSRLTRISIDQQRFEQDHTSDVNASSALQTGHGSRNW
jgi:hypothetical protein